MKTVTKILPLFNECTESSDLSNQYNKDHLRHMSDKSESSLGQSCIDGTVKSKTKSKSLIENPITLQDLKSYNGCRRSYSVVYGFTYCSRF